MKSYLLRLLIAFGILASSFTPVENTKVWLCIGGSAYAYHSKQECSGLQHCKHTIRQTTLDSATKFYSRRPCKECYR